MKVPDFKIKLRGVLAPDFVNLLYNVESTS